MMMQFKQLKNIIEAALLAADRPLPVEQLAHLFDDHEDKPTKQAIKEVIAELVRECAARGIELKQVASGYRYQTRVDMQPWLVRLKTEKPPRYSRALMETLALIVYRQPVTRAEIEDVRGVSVSSSIFKVLLEREWIKIVGHKEVAGRPAMYATTKKFLDYFNLKTLKQLPSLAAIQDLDNAHPELDLLEAGHSKAPVQLRVIESAADTPD